MNRAQNKLSKGIMAIGLGLWLPGEKALIIADLHLGFEEMLNKQGILMPRVNFSDIKQKLEKIFFETEKKFSIVKIIIAGDLKHEFGAISQQEWKEVLDMLEFLQSHCEQVVLVLGNHDKILGPIAEFKKTMAIKSFFFEKSKILVLHGNEIPESPEYFAAKTIIIGHEHPAISLRDATKTETFKCFLKGKFQGKQIIVLPSLSSISYGTDILKQETISLFLKKNLPEFEVWIVEDKAYYFGKIKNIGK